MQQIIFAEGRKCLMHSIYVLKETKRVFMFVNGFILSVSSIKPFSDRSNQFKRDKWKEKIAFTLFSILYILILLV